MRARLTRVLLADLFGRFVGCDIRSGRIQSVDLVDLPPEFDLELQAGTSLVKCSEFTSLVSDHVVWSAEKLQQGMVEPAVKADRKLCKFEDMSGVSKSNQNLFNKDFNRGHLAGAGNHRGTEKSLCETFYMNVNIVAQHKGMNACDWMRLEVLTSRLTSDDRTVYVISGPLWVAGKNKQPTHLFKVILVTKEGYMSYSAAFVLPNTHLEYKPWREYTETFREYESDASIGSVDNFAFIEKCTGVNLEAFRASRDLLELISDDPIPIVDSLAEQARIEGRIDLATTAAELQAVIRQAHEQNVVSDTFHRTAARKFKTFYVEDKENAASNLSLREMYETFKREALDGMTPMKSPSSFARTPSPFQLQKSPTFLLEDEAEFPSLSSPAGKTSSSSVSPKHISSDQPAAANAPGLRKPVPLRAAKVQTTVHAESAKQVSRPALERISGVRNPVPPRALQPTVEKPQSSHAVHAEQGESVPNGTTYLPGFTPEMLQWLDYQPLEVRQRIMQDQGQEFMHFQAMRHNWHMQQMYMQQMQHMQQLQAQHHHGFWPAPPMWVVPMPHECADEKYHD